MLLNGIFNRLCLRLKSRVLQLIAPLFCFGNVLRMAQQGPGCCPCSSKRSFQKWFLMGCFSLPSNSDIRTHLRMSGDILVVPVRKGEFQGAVKCETTVCTQGFALSNGNSARVMTPWCKGGQFSVWEDGRWFQTESPCLWIVFPGTARESWVRDGGGNLYNLCVFPAHSTYLRAYIHKFGGNSHFFCSLIEKYQLIFNN